MSTPATIAKLDGNRLTAIYLHWDGDQAAKTLVNHYADPVKVDQLLDLGGLSSIGPEVGTSNRFGDAYIPENCLAYHRDRGDELKIAVEELPVNEYGGVNRSDIFKALNAHGLPNDYIYLFVGDGWLRMLRGVALTYEPLCSRCGGFLNGNKFQCADCDDEATCALETSEVDS